MTPKRLPKPRPVTMCLAEEVKTDMRGGAILHFDEGTRFGIRKLRRAWFNPASGHYILDAGIYLWSEEGREPWRIVPIPKPRRGRRG